MEKRAIIAIILTFLVIFLWGVVQSKFFPQAPPPSKEVKKEEVAPPEKGIEKKPETKEVKIAKEERPLPKPKILPEKEVSVETQGYWAEFTSQDARLKHFKLKKYQDRVRESSITIKLMGLVHDLLGKKEEQPQEPKPLDLVNTKEDKELPLGMTFINSQISLSDGNWEIDRDQLRLLNPEEKGELTFVKNLDNGLKVFKRYRFTSDKYAVDLEIEIQNASAKEVNLQVGLEWIGRMELEKLVEHENKDYGLKYAYLKKDKVETKTFGGSGTSGCTPGCSAPKKKIEPFESSDSGDIKWFSFEGEYFTALLIPPPSQKSIGLTVKGDEKNLVKADISVPAVSIQPGESVRIPYKVYMGPKDTDRLKGLNANAEKLVDFGYFNIVAKPLLWFLDLSHSVTKNYGIDIILLSILIKVIFLPLTQISFKSMKEMQKIQPEMNRLKEVYKNDKARLQQEIMLLYKRRRVNPMSGCLPMLIQIPVFIALYNALQNALPMRHAPFFLWIRDLSAKDPIYFTPLVMGASMVIQQKMTPSAADPAQAKLMLLMPVMFTFLFLNFPSGLVLYWLVNNVLSIAHQHYLNKK